MKSEAAATRFDARQQVPCDRSRRWMPWLMHAPAKAATLRERIEKRSPSTAQH